MGGLRGATPGGSALSPLPTPLPSLRPSLPREPKHRREGDRSGGGEQRKAAFLQSAPRNKCTTAFTKGPNIYELHTRLKSCANISPSGGRWPPAPGSRQNPYPGREPVASPAPPAKPKKKSRPSARGRDGHRGSFSVSRLVLSLSFFEQPIGFPQR